MNKLCLYTLLCACVVFSIVSTPAQAELIDNGRGLVYDDVLDITWAQPDNSTSTWDDANDYVAGLTLGGVSGWRLPYASVAAGAGPVLDTVNCESVNPSECEDNEMGYMFYVNLSGTFDQSVLTSGDPDLALFPNLTDVVAHWSGTEAPAGDFWWFSFAQGRQSAGSKSFLYLVWPVHDGNISGVPTSKASWGTIKATYR